MKELFYPAPTLFDRRAFRLAMLTIVAWFAVLIMAIAALGDTVRHPDAALARSDFAAFYCGAVVAKEHRDPYALRPLAACEYDRVYRPGGVTRAHAPVDPDPLPGYHMAFFVPFTALPFREAALMFDAVLIAAIAGTAVILAELTGLPIVAVAALLAYLDGFTSIPYGQTSPLAAFGLSLAAYGIVRDRRLAVFCGVALTTIAPHVGVAVWLALFVWRPGLRVGLLAVAAALIGASVMLLGITVNVEYIKLALPAQALAESGTTIQYSLAWLLQYLGLSPAAALRIASMQYGAFLIAGVAAASLIGRRLRTSAALVLFPAAAVLVGGTYIHIQQMALALPFALVLATQTRSRAAWLAVLLLAVPWPADRHLLLLGASAIVVTIVMLIVPVEKPRVARWLGAVAIAAYVCAAGPLMTHIIPAAPHHVLRGAIALPRALDGDRLASAADALQVRANPASAVSTARTLAAKLPTWIALITLLAVALVPRKIPSVIAAEARIRRIPAAAAVERFRQPAQV